MLSVDYSILNVALPQVGAGVGLAFSDLPWVLTAYALPAAGFTLLFGRIADMFGRRRLFLAGIILLALASLIGGFATNGALLLTARTLQGFATAIATPAALSLLITTFSDKNQRPRVLGLSGALLSGLASVAAGIMAGRFISRYGQRTVLAVGLLVQAGRTAPRCSSGSSRTWRRSWPSW